MTNATFTSDPTNSNQTTWRAALSPIDTALAAVGMVQTADTGQINWSTVTRPAASFGVAGYTMWRFPDTLHATVPLYLKLTYGVGNGTAVNRVWAEIGTATDGAGNLTGPGSTATSGFASLVAFAGSTTSAAGSDCYVACDGSGLVINMWANAPTSQGAMLVVDRFRDATGAAMPAGAMLITKSSAAVLGETIIADYGATTATYAAAMFAIIPATLTVGVTFLRSGIVRTFPYQAATDEIYTTKMVLTYAAADLGAGTLEVTDFLGAPRTYRAHGVFQGRCDVVGQTSASVLSWWSD